MARGSRRAASKKFLAALAKSREQARPPGPDLSKLVPPDAPAAEVYPNRGSGRLITIAQAQDVFARYLLDRADQYQADSPCWVALADAAHEVADGEAWADFEHGELDSNELKRRVKGLARQGGKRAVDPRLGTDEVSDD